MLRSGALLVQAGSGLVPAWFRAGASLVPGWCQAGSGLGPAWFRAGAPASVVLMAVRLQRKQSLTWRIPQPPQISPDLSGSHAIGIWWEPVQSCDVNNEPTVKCASAPSRGACVRCGAVPAAWSCRLRRGCGAAAVHVAELRAALLGLGMCVSGSPLLCIGRRSD